MRRVKTDLLLTRRTGTYAAHKRPSESIQLPCGHLQFHRHDNRLPLVRQWADDGHVGVLEAHILV